jgi:hypothetical protein
VHVHAVGAAVELRGAQPEQIAQPTVDADPAFAAANLGNGDFDVLAAFRRTDEPHALRPVELSRTLLVTTGAITKRIDRLIVVRLANERRLLGALTSAEQRTLADLLAKLDAGLISGP